MWRSKHTKEGWISLGSLGHGPENHLIQDPSFGELSHTSLWMDQCNLKKAKAEREQN